MLPSFGIRIEVQKKCAFSDQLVATIARERNEAIIYFQNRPVGDAADHESVRAGFERLCKSFLALAQGFVGPLARGDITTRSPSADNSPIFNNPIQIV